MVRHNNRRHSRTKLLQRKRLKVLLLLRGFPQDPNEFNRFGYVFFCIFASFCFQWLVLGKPNTKPMKSICLSHLSYVMLRRVEYISEMTELVFFRVILVNMRIYHIVFLCLLNPYVMPGLARLTWNRLGKRSQLSFFFRF